MLNYWTTSFSGFEPVAHLLKSAFPDRWVRFHSLPESKRYAESDAEYAALLDRHNAVLGALAAAESPVVLLATESSSSARPISPPSYVPDARWWRSVSVEHAFWHVYAAAEVWRPGRFDAVLRRAADDDVHNLMICDTGCRWIFHPYDGGMDVVLANTTARNGLRERFGEWLSSLASGL